MSLPDTELSRRARRIRDLVEPVAANVYFAPEVHAAFASLGYGPGAPAFNGVTGPDPVAYFTSRGACLGAVPGEVVAAAFGVFNPEVVVPCVSEGWKIADRDTVLAARQDGATASLRRVLGDEPAGADRATALLRRMADAAGFEGRHLFGGLRSLGFPGDLVGDLWRAADLVREHRGDSHIAAWVAHGLDAPEIGLLTELWWGLPARSYVRTRAWSTAQLDAAADRLRARGLLAGDGLTDAGRELREQVEWTTDLQERPLIEALGDDAAELFGLLEPWSDAIVAAGGYPRRSGLAATRG